MTYYSQYHIEYDVLSQGVSSCSTAYVTLLLRARSAHALHLDVFEHIIPAALIRDVLTETQSWEEREQALTMPIVIITIIAMGLFSSLSIPHVLHKIAQGLRYIWSEPCVRLPGASAISQRRQQLGVRPLRRLFEFVCQPRATSQTPGAFAFGLRLMAIDSTVETWLTPLPMR